MRVGEKVTIKATAFDASATGTVAFVGALIGEQTRTAKARVVLTTPEALGAPACSSMSRWCPKKRQRP